MAYPNLVAEMARRDLDARDLAKVAKKSPDTLRNWLRGKGDFTVAIAFLIQQNLFPDCKITYLFSNTPALPDEAPVS